MNCDHSFKAYEPYEILGTGTAGCFFESTNWTIKLTCMFCGETKRTRIPWWEAFMIQKGIDPYVVQT